jgi:hypothetical protein
MNEKEIAGASSALKKELHDSIRKKLDQIRENLILEKGSDKPSYYQMLINVDEELDDVLLNWDYSPINPRLSFQDQYDLGDAEDDDDLV